MNEKWVCACGETAQGNVCKACGSTYDSPANVAVTNVKQEINGFLRSPLMLVLALLFGFYAVSSLATMIIALITSGLSFDGIIGAVISLFECGVFVLPFIALLRSYLTGKGIKLFAKTLYVYRIVAVVASIIGSLICFGCLKQPYSIGTIITNTLHNVFGPFSVETFNLIWAFIDFINIFSLLFLPVLLHFVLSSFEELPNNIIYRTENPTCPSKLYSIPLLKRIIIFEIIFVILAFATGIIGGLVYAIYSYGFEILEALPTVLYFITTILLAIIEFALGFALLLLSSLLIAMSIVDGFLLACLPVVVIMLILNARYVYTEYKIAQQLSSIPTSEEKIS